MQQIYLGYKSKVNDEIVKMYSKLNTNNKPIYDWRQMSVVRYAMLDGIEKEQIETFMKLNKKGKPIYSNAQMEMIYTGFFYKLTHDEIEIYSKLNKDEKPIFKAYEMKAIFMFIKTADKKQIEQLNECINENLTFKQLKPLLDVKLSPERIRILRSFYSLDKDEEFVKDIVNSEYSYEDLKKIKYREQCIRQINIKREKGSYLSYISDQVFKDIFFEKVLKNFKVPYTDKRHDILVEAFENKLKPEQIAFLCDFNVNCDIENMKAVYDGFTKGLSTEEMRDIIELKDKLKYFKSIEELVEETLDYKETLSKISEKDFISPSYEKEINER